jgi:uncharacterized SAM-binding protein YcdF (DUF218 family)
MFVFLSKFLPQWVYPLGIVCILLVLGILLQRHAKLRNSAILVALVILLLGSNRWVSMALVRGLEWQYLPPANIPNTDVIVLLGGGTESQDYPRPSVEVNGAGDRVLYAAYLYKQGKAPHILLSGGSIAWMGTHTSTPAQEMAEILKLTDVPETALWLQNKSQNTYEDALYSAIMLKEKKINRIILVTSAAHMPRSVALFKAQGLDVIPAPTDYSVTESEWKSAFNDPSIQNLLVSLVPSVGNLSATTGVLKEDLGLWVYQLRGWTLNSEN